MSTKEIPFFQLLLDNNNDTCDDCDVMQKLTIGAFEARRQLSKLIENTRYKEQKLIIEKNGEEMAALVPVKILREWEEERERFFDSLFSGRRS